MNTNNILQFPPASVERRIIQLRLKQVLGSNDYSEYRRFSHTTEHDRVHAIEINKTDCEVLQAYL
jgi:hypothetical protein